jgi:hypothetical protein
MPEILEPLDTAETGMSGVEVIDDLLNRLGEALSQSCDLRGTDAYSSYAARVTVELQLQDIDRVEVRETLVIGDYDRAKPSRPFHIELPTTTASQMRERSGAAPPEANLERTVTGDIPEPPARNLTETVKFTYRDIPEPPQRTSDDLAYAPPKRQRDARGHFKPSPKEKTHAQRP